MKIGYVIADYGDVGHQPDYLETRKAALEAESAGFDSIWLYDHLLYRFLPNTPTIGCMGPRMMGLTAQYGDIWNTAYMGAVDPKYRFAAELLSFSPSRLHSSSRR